MSLPRFLSAAAAITWLIAAVRVWDDAHNPYTTGLCVLIAATFGVVACWPHTRHDKKAPR
ncbi:hypothetical protein EBQ10_02925 [Trueperella pyogenes]|uniref:DUF2530 domain-containing protein n=1 Tax=Trueperella pyogenes TaxID=1661 RepID=A0A3Q9GLL4_9ACTO|nr:hypothetical protein [Trueperella pyogenes]AZR06346.1 hypothetical protein EBQ10_02925 [Trueperella pyogenes]